jgi:hypothetical protein
MIQNKQSADFVSGFEDQFNFLNKVKEDYMEMSGAKFGTDKILHHRYHQHYAFFLDHLRSIRGGAILEIGIDTGASLNFWLEYFPYSFVYGIDIGVSTDGLRFKILKADQSDLAELNRIIDSEISHPVFTIIDDGSHIPEHQAICFNFLFARLLVPGGVYIIEDVEVSYWTQGGLYGYETQYGYRHPNSIVECFKHLPDDINNEFMKDENKSTHNQLYKGKISNETRALVKSITFGKNCIIITKKSREEMDAEKRDYRFSGYL